MKYPGELWVWSSHTRLPSWFCILTSPLGVHAHSFEVHPYLLPGFPVLLPGQLLYLLCSSPLHGRRSSSYFLRVSWPFSKYRNLHFSNYPDRSEGVRDGTPGKMKNVTCVSFSLPGALLCQLPLSPSPCALLGGCSPYLGFRWAPNMHESPYPVSDQSWYFGSMGGRPYSLQLVLGVSFLRDGALKASWSAGNSLPLSAVGLDLRAHIPCAVSPHHPAGDAVVEVRGGGQLLKGCRKWVLMTRMGRKAKPSSSFTRQRSQLRTSVLMFLVISDPFPPRSRENSSSDISKIQ